MKSQLIGKDPDAGKIEGKRRIWHHRMRWLDGIMDSMDINFSKLWGSLVCCSPWGHKESDLKTEQPPPQQQDIYLFIQKSLLYADF